MKKTKNITIVIFAVIIVLMIGFGIVAATSGLGGFGIKPSVVSNSGVVGFWSLNASDSSGTTIYDKSGNGNNGVSANTPVFTEDQNGVANQAMVFNGTSDYIDCGNNSTIQPSSNMSIAGWVKSDVTSGTHNVIWRFFADNNNRIYFSSHGISYSVVNGSAQSLHKFDIADTKWHHLAVTISGTTYKYYIDSVLTYTETALDLSNMVGTFNFQLGLDSSTYRFDGSISDTAVYHKTLSQLEISQLYKSERNSSSLKINAQNKVSNGEFDIDSIWHKTTGWSISDGKAIASGVTDYHTLYQNLSPNTLIVGRTYKVIIDVVELNSGKFSFYLAGSGSSAQAENNIDSVGIHTFYKTLDTVLSQKIALRGYPDVDGSIEYFKIIDITNSLSNGSLQKGLILDVPLAEPYTKAYSNVISNGDFSAHTGDDFDSWGEAGGGTITHESDSTYADFCRIKKLTGTTYIYQSPTRLKAIKDKKYYISYDIKGPAGASFKVQIGAGSGNLHPVTTSWTHNVFIQQATGTGGIYFISYTTNAEVDITNIIVKPLDDIILDKTPYGNNGTNDGATIKYDGLVNSTDGVSYISQSKAYGTWEFDLNSPNSSQEIIQFISDTNKKWNIDAHGYMFGGGAYNTLNFYRMDGSTVTVLFSTAHNYISAGTDYRIKITRDLTGVFTIYIKGGFYPWDTWTKISVSSGSNSVTDNTYTSSNYFVVDLDAGDRLSNLKIDNRAISLNKAVQSTGTWTTSAPSYSFDGDNDYINFTTGLVSDTGTLSIWLRPEYISGVEVILSYTDGSNGFGLGIADNSYLSIFTKSTNQKKISFNNNEWNHVVVTKSAGLIQKVYLNGVEQSLSSDSGWSMVNEFKLGNLSSGTYYFHGQLSNLKMWNRVLNSDEIDSLYQKEKRNFN